jgi:ribosome-binding factor A
MTEQRAHRVAEEIKREVSDILRKDLKDPRLAGLGLISVTGVDVSRDLRYARIYISVLGDAQEAGQAVNTLKKATGFIRSEIGRRIRLRYTPELTFQADSSIAYGAHINRLLNGLNRDESNESGE